MKYLILISGICFSLSKIKDLSFNGRDKGEESGPKFYIANIFF